jgi:Sulfotransferase domain
VAGNSEPLDPEMWPEEIKSARPEDFEGLASPPFDKERFMTYPIPLTFFGAIWSAMTRKGTSEVRRVRRDGLLTMRYERLLRDTRTELARLADFIGVPADSRGISPDTFEISPDRQWLDLACQYVDAGRSGSATAQLHPIDLAALRSVCAAGKRAFDVFESEQVVSAELRS